MKLYPKRGFEFAAEGCAGLWCPVLTGNTGYQVLDSNLRTNNNGNATGYANASQPWGGSEYGSHLNLDGTTNHVADCGNTSSFAFMINPYVFTIEVWFRLNSLSVRQALAGSTTATSDRGFFLLHEIGAGGGTNSIRLGVTHGTTGQSKDLRSPNSIVVAGWNHAVIIGRTTAANSAMIVNGRQVAITASQDSTLSAGAATRAMSIGAARTSTGITLPTAGQIASFAIWDKPMTIGNAQTFNNAGPGGAWQLEPVRRSSYFAELLQLPNRRRSSRFLAFPG